MQLRMARKLEKLSNVFKFEHDVYSQNFIVDSFLW